MRRRLLGLAAGACRTLVAAVFAAPRRHRGRGHPGPRSRAGGRCHPGLCIGLLAAAGPAAACEQPALPEALTLPADAPLADSDTDALVDTFTEYSDAMRELTRCIVDELEDAGGDDAPALERGVLVRRNNAVVAELTAVADLVDDRLRAAGSPGLMRRDALDAARAASTACLTVARIDRTAVRDNEILEFEMRDGTVRLNDPEVCPGLHGRVVVELPGNTGARICQGQLIGVYDPSLELSTRCRLGPFYPGPGDEVPGAVDEPVEVDLPE